MLCSRKYGPENDYHPAYAIIDTGRQPITVWEELVKQFTCGAKQSRWNSTLVGITFDEHGAVTTMYRLSLLAYHLNE